MPNPPVPPVILSVAKDLTAYPLTNPPQQENQLKSRTKTIIKQKYDITILNLLTHTAGFAPFKSLHILCNDYEDSIKYICSSDLEYKSGTNVVYSDFSYIMLAHILEKIGNERFLSGISGHVGLFSNIEDVSKFVNMLINRWKDFMSLPAFDAMIRNYTKGMDENRGIGWCIKGNELSSGGDIVSPSAFWHTSFTVTLLWLDIENNTYVALLTNRVHPTRNIIKIIRFRRVFHNAVLSALE